MKKYLIIVIIILIFLMIIILNKENKKNLDNECYTSYTKFLSCLKEKNIDPSKFNLDKSYKDEIIRDYYINFYSDLPNMIKHHAKTKDEIEIKKQIINNMKGRLKPSDCDKLPEIEVKEYCLSILK